MLAEKTVQHLLCGRFIAARRDGHAIGSDQLLEQSLQVSPERENQLARILRSVVSH
jgi:hypothetical protein